MTTNKEVKLARITYCSETVDFITLGKMIEECKTRFKDHTDFCLSSRDDGIWMIGKKEG